MLSGNFREGSSQLPSVVLEISKMTRIRVILRKLSLNVCFMIVFRLIADCHELATFNLTLFDMGGGGMMAPQNVFDHCSQTLWRRKLKLGDF